MGPMAPPSELTRVHIRLQTSQPIPPGTHLHLTHFWGFVVVVVFLGGGFFVFLSYKYERDAQYYTLLSFLRQRQHKR